MFYNDGKLYSQQYRQELDRTRLLQTTAPSGFPITKAEVKKHLNVGASDSSHDDLLDEYISSATAKYEQDTDTGILTQSWTQFFPVLQDGLTLTKRICSSVTSVKYYDSGNDLQTLSTDVYAFDSTTQQIRLKPEQTFPATYERFDAVFVEYVVGVNQSSVSSQVKHALYLLIGAWFDGDRGDNPNPPTHKTYYNLIANNQRASYP